MQSISSYGVEINKQNLPICHTLKVYRQAVSYLIRAYAQAWESLSTISSQQKRFNKAEHLVHGTKKNRAQFDFDHVFPKMPSYLRRSAIQHALGSVGSYKKRMELWEKGKLSGKPKLVSENHAMPVFYRDVMYRKAEGEEDAADLKLFDGHDWKWFRVKLKHTDLEYLRRKFINFPSDKDRMYRVLGRISRFQRTCGSKQIQSRWSYARRMNKELAQKISSAITEYAGQNHADVIVFEHLEMSGKQSGKRKQRLHLWKKQDIQNLCEHQAHRKGIRISRICAWNTSRLAYDGSGTVVRDPKNHSLCTFPTGKQYNCDLSAAYNIGARYFIRELLKPLPATERSLLEAKVPSVKRRTSCVYADLLQLAKRMQLRESV